MKKILLIAIMMCCLQGCVGAFVAGAAAGGAVIYDRRNLKTLAQDVKLSAAVSRAIHRDREFRGSHIVTSSYHSVLLLAGQTPKDTLRVKAEQIAKAQPRVKRIYNEITINSPTSPLTRTSDSWITTKVKTEMLARKGLKSGAVKVITENGVVFLMGEVSPKQADLAVGVARDVSGVQKVVKVFDFA